jgi:hypothetical protein
VDDTKTKTAVAKPTNVGLYGVKKPIAANTTSTQPLELTNFHDLVRAEKYGRFCILKKVLNF